jgi:O-antigen ligase
MTHSKVRCSATPWLVLTLIALATLAFGAVYPWAYLPLFVAATTIGVIGIGQYGIVPTLRPVVVGLVLLSIAVAIQLIPLPVTFVNAISPSTRGIMNSYDLGFVSDAEWLRMSIDPARTRIALFALVALGIYVIGLASLLDARGLRLLPRGLALVAVPLALFVIYSRQHNNGLIYGFWEPLDGGGADQAGPFINRNHFGGWIVMSLCVMIGWLLGKIERVPRVAQKRWPIMADEIGAVLLMATAIAFGTISLFWIVSRSAITSFGAAVVVFAWFVVKRRHMNPARQRLVLVALGVVIIAAASFRGIDMLARWFVDERSLLSRIDAWRDGWNVVRDFPVLGTGLNTYSPAMLLYQEHNPGFHMAQAHNDYLQLVAEGGVIVVLAAAGTVILMINAMRRTLRAASIEARGYWVRAGSAVGLMAIAFQEIAEFSLQIPANAFLFCTLAALTVTPVRSGTPAGIIPRGNIDVPEEPAGAALS